MSTETRRVFLKQGAALAASAAAQSMLPMSALARDPAPFAPSWESLANYQTPDWFRDAKFGIWAHWGPQCVPEEGDWYARQMYQEGNHDYKYQCDHYGHPSKAGFKDVIHTWNADAWDPEHLIGLYKAAGAKYFMALANHHDNFDNYDSTWQSWNSVKMGPKRDLVGGWEKAVRRAGLKFGVSIHAAHAWSWYEVAQGADKMGPLTGVPYDGKLTKADGKGLWWEGLDPQELYAQSHTPGKGLEWDWNAAKGSSVPDAAYCEKFYRRTIELIDKYHPEMLYFDDTVLPLYPISDVGLRIAAYHYNDSLKRNRGRLEAVLTGKVLSEQQRKCIVWDIERGSANTIQPLPWQTDTCIGDWHYNRHVLERHGYKTPQTVVHMLIDIVSKNGNLMLNIPLPGSGVPDADELAFLAGLTEWMRVNSEGIYGTRPWKIYGEGPVAESAAAPIKAQGFNEGKGKPFGADDIRFVTKGADTLYAFAMGWPTGGTLTIKSLGTSASGKVERVELLGVGQAPFTRDANGLTITLPGQKPGDHAFAFRIQGRGIAEPAPVHAA